MTLRIQIGVLLLCGIAQAQEADRRVGTYNVVNSYEFGYRATSINGNQEAYRSSVNYSNGVRLFNGLLRVNSRDGHGRFVDEIVLTTLGSGGDPYQSNSLRLEKNGLYRFDAGFRIVNYYNQLLALSGGEHRFNTERIFQNYDLTLFPNRAIQFLFGFDRNNQNGPALTSENIGVRGEPAFPRERFFVFADNVRRLNNQWRVGANFTAAGMRFSFLRGWDYYKEDTRHSPASETVAGGLLPRTLRRDDPVHGRTPFTRLNVHSDASRRFALNGRFVYAGGDRNFVLDENISALNPISGVVVTRQAFVLGQGQRRQGTGDLTLSFQPGERWAFSNTTSVNQTRITGDSAFVELRAPANRLDPDRDEFFFSVLSFRHIANATDVNFRPAKALGFYGGYHYSIRRIQSREILEDISGAPTGVPLNSFENTTHSVLGGLRLRPLSPLTMLFDVEYGRADRPFTPVSEKRFHAETARVQWKSRTWLATGAFRAYRNRSSLPVPGLVERAPTSGHTYLSRQYSASVGWTPPRRPVAFEAGYSRLHLDTASGILNFPVPDLVRPSERRSLYVSNLHHAHGTLRAEVVKKVTLSLGYSLVKDTADGRRRAQFVFPFAASYPNFTFDGSDLINAYPLSYQSPHARLSLRLHRKLSWNVGWQYYSYSERFTGSQNYFAHIATISVRWAF